MQEFNPTLLKKSIEIWETLISNITADPTKEFELIWYYESILAASLGLRGSVIMLYDIERVHGLFKTREEKIAMLLESIKNSIPGEMAMDLLYYMEYKENKLADSMDLNKSCAKSVLSLLEKNPLNANMPREILAIKAQSVGRIMAHTMRQAIEKLNVCYTAEENEKDSDRFNSAEAQEIVRNTLFLHIQNLSQSPK